MRAKSIIGFAAGPIVSAVLGLLITPVMAWIFTPEDIGRLNIFQVSLSFLLLLTVLGLDQAYVREYHECKARPRLLLTCFLPGFLLLFFIALTAIPFASEISILLFDSNNPWIVFVFLFSAVINYLSRFLSLILRMQERGWAFSLSQIGPKVLQLALVLVIAYSTLDKNFVNLAAVTTISIFFVTLLYGWNTRHELIAAMKATIQTDELKKLFQFGFPLIFSGLAYWGLTATSTFALRTFSNLEQLAVYSLANNFAGAAFIFQSIFTVVWAPTVYKWLSQDVDMAVIDKVAQQALAVVCAVVALSGSFSWICDYLLPSQYSEVKYILISMLLPPLLYTLSEITCVGIAIQRRTIYSLWITLTAFVTNLCLSYFLVPKYGAAGAAASNAVAFTIFFIARTEVSIWIWRKILRHSLYIYIGALLIGSIATLVIGPNSAINIHLLWSGSIIWVVIAFRTQWISLLGGFKTQM